MKNIWIAILSVFLGFSTGMAQQFDLSAEVRPRYENRNGYRSLHLKGDNPGSFISQRSRINFDFQQSKLKLRVTLQNVRTWGDVGTLSSDDRATALHESWAEAKLSKKVSMKLGRQEIVYDDHRIFGTVGWAQQARSHDAMLVKFKPNDKHKLDLGLAYNADFQSGNDPLYSNAAGYKTFQYLHYHGDFDKLGLSFLALNTGVEYLKNVGTADEKQAVDFMQTIGPRLTFKSDKISANAAGYFQLGKTTDIEVGAAYASANFAYKINDNFKLGAGFEYLSGKGMDDTDAKIKSFAPLFGTNHKFNGWMDYFYVGNHGNSVGLTDINLTLAYKKDKFSAKLVPHLFSSAANVLDSTGAVMAKGLGTEIDLTVAYKISSNVKVSGGYSQMLATESMEILKGGDKDAFNSWAWLMFTFKPKLFSYKAPKK